MRYTLRLHETLTALRRLATRDPLTTLINRREGLRLLEREVQRARQYGRSLSVLLIDVDHFKRVNDKLGPANGDRVLASIALKLKMAVREMDSAVRWDGDEFSVWLPEQDAVAARQSAENIVVAIRGLGHTVSIGVAQWIATRDEATGLLAAADQALREAKSSGRDRVA